MKSPPERRSGALHTPRPATVPNSPTTGDGSESAAEGCDQLSLDDLPPAARTTDRGTSWEAARALTPELRGRKIRKVVQVIARAGDRGTICHDVALVLGSDRGNTARRITDAHRRGLIRAEGVRRAPSGRHQTVWKITASGLTEAARHLADAS